MKVSDRVNAMQYSAIRKLTPYAKEAKDRGIKVHHLNIGAPDIETPEVFFESVGAFKQKTLSYAPSIGLEDLRQAMSDYYKDLGLSYSQDEIVITVGASEALLFSLIALCDPGDEIITADPYYSNYKTYMDQAMVGLNTFPTEQKNAFAFPSKEEILGKITDKTRAILICNPANPTGAVVSKEEVEMVSEIAKEKDLFVIADEIYQDFIYTDEDFYSFAKVEDIADRVLVLDSISKRYSACGARIGAIMAKNEEVLESIRKLATGRLAAPTLEQVGAAALYRMKGTYLEDVRKEYRERRDLVYEMLSKIEGVGTYKSQGAFYTIASLPVDDTDKFAKWLLTDFNHEGETLMVAPAQGFYKEGTSGSKEVRIAFAVSQEEINRALELLEIAIKEYNSL